MATVNPFDLLDDDTEDLHKLVAAKPLKSEKTAPVQLGKLPTKPLPPSQAGEAFSLFNFFCFSSFDSSFLDWINWFCLIEFIKVKLVNSCPEDIKCNR